MHFFLKTTRSYNKDKETFPYKLLLVYMVYYMAQPFYQTYITVYQSQVVGMSKALIGSVGSIAALVILFVKPLIGIVTDRSKNKNRVVVVLLVAASVTVMGFYVSEAMWWVILCLLGFNIVYAPIATLQDSNAVEYLGERKGGWHFGHVRLGGTLGFMIAAYLSGYIIGDQLNRMFWITGLFCLIAAAIHWTMPKVPGTAKNKEKVKYLEILKNRPMLSILFLQITNSLGLVFMSYYSIYLTDPISAGGLGYGNEWIGIVAFCNAILEIPFFWYAGRIQNRLGVRNFMTLSVFVMAFKVILLSVTTSIHVILLSTAITGFSFVGIQFCTVNFINEHIPKEMRTTAQTVNGLMATVFARILFAPFGGWMADCFGVAVMMRIGAVIITIGGVLFFFLYSAAMKYHTQGLKDSL